MIWKSRLFLKDKLGEKRIVEKFLWFPRMFNKHWYWLIEAKLEQTVIKIDVGGSMEWGKYSYEWVTTGIYINIERIRLEQEANEQAATSEE